MMTLVIDRHGSYPNPLDLRPGDILQVVEVEDNDVRVELVHRPEMAKDMPPPAIGVSVSDGVGTADRVG